MSITNIILLSDYTDGIYKFRQVNVESEFSFIHSKKHIITCTNNDRERRANRVHLRTAGHVSVYTDLVDCMHANA